MINNIVSLIKWSVSYAQKIDSEKLYCTNEEKENGKRFKRINDKTAHLLGRSYIRKICSNRIEIPPASISISRDSYGRPFLTDYSNVLDFNISHSESMLAIGINTQGKIGVDLERIKKLDIQEVKNFFTHDEISYINNSNSGKTRRLYQVWTSIEAYSKLLGVGLDKQIKSRHFVAPNENQSLIQNAEMSVYISSFEFDSYILSVASEKNNVEVKINKILLA